MPLEQVSLRILCNVLNDGVRFEKANSDYLLLKQDLGRTVAEPVLDSLYRHGTKINPKTRITHLDHHIDGRIRINDEVSDAVILAASPYRVDAPLPEDTPDYIQTAYQSLHYRTTTAVYLRYVQTAKLSVPLAGFADGTAQWMLYWGVLGLPDGEVTVAINVSDYVEIQKDKDLVEKIHTDIRWVCPDLDRPEAIRIITGRHVTTAATIDSVQSNSSWLHHCRIYPASDCLHPHYSATPEAVAQSGFAAAEKPILDLQFE